MNGTLTPRYSKEEFARRGEEIYKRDIYPQMKPEDKGKFVLIDIETGEYELDWDEMAAGDRLFARRSDAQVWMRRVGFSYARRRLRFWRGQPFEGGISITELPPL